MKRIAFYWLVISHRPTRNGSRRRPMRPERPRDLECSPSFGLDCLRLARVCTTIRFESKLIAVLMTRVDGLRSAGSNVSHDIAAMVDGKVPF